MVATVDNDGSSVLVGDRRGHLYAYHLADGSAVPGWPASDGGEPIDSTPSVAPISGGSLDSVFVGTGNAQLPGTGGYEAYGPGPTAMWITQVLEPPTDQAADYGVQASLTVGDLQGGADVFAGSLDQEAYALNASDGSVLTGWPFFSADSNFSTAAVGDLYGTGHDELVTGGASSSGFALGQNYSPGGHLRILNSRGGLICHYDTNQEIDSSPAVGGFLGGGATGIVVGTGSFYSGVSDSDTLKAFNTRCDLLWSDTLDGFTGSSPALANVEGNGTTDVVEGTDNGSSGSVWVVGGANGAPLWHTQVVGRVIGSAVTADLTGDGYQDVLVPTTGGVEVLDGRSGSEITVLRSDLGFQNSPLVTDDPNGSIGITIAGYNGDNQGIIVHYEIPGSDGAEAVGGGSWPMFHHDPQLTGVSSGLPARGSVPSCDVPPAAIPGYDLAGSDGGIFSSGQPFCGSAGGLRLSAPIVGMAMSPRTGGYWLVASDGGVFTFGNVGYFGSMGGHRLNAPVVGIAATPDGNGYWLVASDGGIFTFGDAGYFGSMGGHRLKAPVVGIAATADGQGYRLVGSDGGVFTFGDGQFFGSMGGTHLNAPVTGIEEDVGTGGYWLVGSDGGVFSFGAPFFGSTGAIHLVQPILGMCSTEDGRGYWMVAADGGVFSFGDATFFGSVAGARLNGSMVAMGGFSG